jgi:hypothetical protein
MRGNHNCPCGTKRAARVLQQNKPQFKSDQNATAYQPSKKEKGLENGNLYSRRDS